MVPPISPLILELQQLGLVIGHHIEISVPAAMLFSYHFLDQTSDNISDRDYGILRENIRERMQKVMKLTLASKPAGRRRKKKPLFPPFGRHQHC